jgi:alkanesulfonate monooxygenase SsuD/methylene tetrahydromethanopterin reductase-like flavin-dependent oxidoreductase (luciferase family)
VRLGIAIDLDAPVEELRRRAEDAEQRGFDVVYAPDHSRDWRFEEVPAGAVWFDALTLLTVFAAATSRTRIGTLVANPVLRPPDLLAREAIALDHVSDGRMELGIGTGIAPFDHRATGTPAWSFAERVDRFDEYVEVVDGLLRAGIGAGNGGAFTFSGRFYRTDHDGLPLSVQQPRLPITLGGSSVRVRRAAVRRAECWNTHGRWGVAPEGALDDVVSLNREVDAECERQGRDPATLRRSVLLFGALDPWRAPGELARLVDTAGGGGYEEFVVLWPWDPARRKVFDADTADLARYH